MFECVSGRHVWMAAEDAARCCNGFVRCLAVQTLDGQVVLTLYWTPTTPAIEAEMTWPTAEDELRQASIDNEE